MRSSVQLVLVASVIALSLAQARAEEGDELFAGVVRLRGGYDANPTLVTPARGSPFIGFDGAFVGGREAGGGYRAGVVAESSLTNYGVADIDPQQRHKLTFTIASKDDGGLSTRSTTTLGYASSYNLRASDLVQSVRGQWMEGVFRPFLTLEGRYSTLNETNALFPDFLPVGSRYLRGATIPGVALNFGKMEIGTSVNLSITRYMETFDEFGYRRDNERVQPFLFVKYNSEAFDLFASVSQFCGFWHDVDFSNVDRTMFNVTATYRLKPFTFEVAATREAAETTFALSPITVLTTFGGKVRWAVTEKDALTVAASNVRTEYLDTLFVSETRSIGVGLAHALSPDLAVGLDVTYTQFMPIAGERANAALAMFSLTKRFGSDAKPSDKKDTGGGRPPVRVAGRTPFGNLPAWTN